MKIWKSGFWRDVNSDVKKSHANYVKAYFQSSLTQICIDLKKSNFAQICQTKYTWLCTSNVSKLEKDFTELIVLKLWPILNRLFLKEILHYGKYTLSYFVFVCRETKAEILVFNWNYYINIFIYQEFLTLFFLLILRFWLVIIFKFKLLWPVSRRWTDRQNPIKSILSIRSYF